jgi:hypothetical protein
MHTLYINTFTVWSTCIFKIDFHSKQCWRILEHSPFAKTILSICRWYALRTVNSPLIVAVWICLSLQPFDLREIWQTMLALSLPTKELTIELFHALVSWSISCDMYHVCLLIIMWHMSLIIIIFFSSIYIILIANSVLLSGPNHNVNCISRNAHTIARKFGMPSRTGPCPIPRFWVRLSYPLQSPRSGTNRVLTQQPLKSSWFQHPRKSNPKIDTWLIHSGLHGPYSTFTTTVTR